MKYNNYRFVLILSLPILLISISCKGGKKYTTPEYRNIVESVYASATVKAADQYSVISPVAGILLSNDVKEGDSVAAGQIIARIDNANPALSAENSKLAFEQAKQNYSRILDELDAQIRTATEQHKLDSLNYLRQKSLWEKNVGTQSALENRKLAFEASGNTLRSLQSRYLQTRTQLGIAMEQAANNYAITSKNSGDFNITSRLNGRVYALNYEPGEMVTQQKAVAVIGDAGKFVLELTVDEVDISRIRIGQRTALSMDAYRNEIWEAVITKIYPNLDARSQSFIVEAAFTRAPEKLYPGMSAEASIILGEKKQALVIPLDYLTKEGRVLTDEGEKLVKTGIRNLEFVEILEGIDTKTKLLKP